MTSTQSARQSEPPPPEKPPEDVYEFKEPEPFELELHDEKKKRTHRIFDDISPSKYTSTLSKSLSEEIAEDPLKPRPSTLRSPSLSPFRDFSASHEIGKQSPREDSKDCLFSMDDDSFPGDGSSGPTFEGFTPAKNQETYSKKSKVSKLRELIDDSPDSPADDEQSSDDEQDMIIKVEDEEEKVQSPNPTIVEKPKTPEPVVQEEQETPKPVIEIKEEQKEIDINEEPIEISIPEPPISSSQQTKDSPIAVSVVSAFTTSIITIMPSKEETIQVEQPKVLSIPLLPIEPKEIIIPKIVIEQKSNIEPLPSKLEIPSSPLIDTEEDKSEPDSPARIDVLPEPPPAFLLQSEGPKIAEKLLKAISSAKRLSMSPPPMDDNLDVNKLEPSKSNKSDIKLSLSPEPKTTTLKVDSLKPLLKNEPKKVRTPDIPESIFGEPSNMTDAKRDGTDIKKVKPKDPTPPRLQSPLNILERRRSVADLTMPVPGKNNKVLSDTIQKLSSQINQAAAAAAIMPLPPFQADDRSESSDSDDSNRRYIVFISPSLKSLFMS